MHILNANASKSITSLSGFRSAASLLKASASSTSATDCQIEDSSNESHLVSTSRPDLNSEVDKVQQKDLRLPFLDWFAHEKSKHQHEPQTRYIFSTV